MSFTKEIKELLEKVEKKSGKNEMPGNVYLLDDETVVCYPREDGDSRYPYENDGYTLWASASGYMHAREGRFYTLAYAESGADSDVNFFVGFPTSNGKYTYYPILNIPVMLNDDAERFTVFATTAIYYFLKCKGHTFCLRAFTGKKKRLYFSLYAENETGAKSDLMVSAYINPWLRSRRLKDEDARWFEKTEILSSDENLLAISYTDDGIYSLIKSISSSECINKSLTTSRDDYVGGNNRSLSANLSLINGEFKKSIPACADTHDSVYGDIRHFEIEDNETLRIDYCFSHYASRPSEEEITAPIIAEDIDAQAVEMLNKRKAVEERLKIKFADSTDENFDCEKFNNFISFVRRQTEFCSISKYYAWSESLGVRDVFQQMEPTAYWYSEEIKPVIREALSVIESNGRAPREYAPCVLGLPLAFSLKKYIDQGVWIISMMNTFLKITGDKAFFAEELGYYEFPDNDPNKAFASEERDSILEHLIRIQDFLISCKAADTGCTRILFGDWNDPLQAVGRTDDPNEEYGTGVSVMAALQVYKNLEEMIEMLTFIDEKRYSDKIAEYKKEREELQDSLLKYAVVKKEDGENRIIHGWGDKVSYLIGSFCDGDGKDRTSLTANAYWVLSGMIDASPELKETVLNAFSRLDGKYGLKTFDKAFDESFKQLIGITTQDAGTLENATTYIHAATFGVYALFKLGEYKKAWTEFKKLLPYTHKFVSHSPFVMCNAYMENDRLSIDGEAVNDWMTGSATVLLKMIINVVCGYNPEYSGIIISPIAELPFSSFDFEIEAKNVIVKISYQNEGNGIRSFVVNGCDYEEKANAVYIPYENLEGKTEIMINITD